MKSKWIPAVLAAAFLACHANAHHSFAKFDSRRSIELAGEITEVRWQNPHIQFTLAARGEDGETRIWTLETASPGILRRSGITSDNVSVGDVVRVAGDRKSVV